MTWNDPFKYAKKVVPGLSQVDHTGPIGTESEKHRAREKVNSLLIPLPCVT